MRGIWHSQTATDGAAWYLQGKNVAVNGARDHRDERDADKCRLSLLGWRYNGEYLRSGSVANVAIGSA